MNKKAKQLLELGWEINKGFFSGATFYTYKKNGLYAILDDYGLSVEDNDTIFDSLTKEELEQMSVKDIHEYVLEVMEG